MNKCTSFLRDFIADESGLTAVEYAIAGGLLVGGMVTAFVQLGSNTQGRMAELCEAASADGTTATGCT
jgi:pilus assembly protein Flp/PilA